MSEHQSSYRQIFKATSLFGGVQVFNIILSIVRSKIIAVLLGPAGMGVAGLLTATTGLVANLTNFGLGTSAVRDIAAANEANNTERITRVITVFRKLVWLTGFLGMIVTLIFSSYLSQITFGNKDYTLGFALLSCTLLFTQLISGQDVILQGMRKLKQLAKANMVAATLGLATSVPLYYIYGKDGIIPAIIVSSLTTLVVTWYFAKSVKVKSIDINLKQTIFEGKSMLKMGIMLSISGLITVLVSYIVRIYISNLGGIKDVGLYNAGFAIIGTYVGLIFTAMGTDYYPRLTGVSNDNGKMTDLVNHQSEIAILILSPILCVFLVFIKFVVLILYSNEFIAVNEMVHWAAIGMYFKAISWSLGFIILAKGDTKVFLWNELSANIYVLVFNILGYKYWGLNGLGISFFLSYVVYLVQVYIVVSKKYNFLLLRSFYKIFVLQLILGLLCFLNIRFIALPWAYLIGVVLIILSVANSVMEMDKRLGIKNALKKFTKQK
ncbi:O-antigen translocase [uncultured Flavobacterium sp.]|uniref:O-antigen translocase n=1 Tax=uncultured Flavobacterium sp. TaxID=165435 RepID=UPI0025DD3E2F|nr:O-antigen translocase [uncultured Flavobacterium sp.]